MHLIYACSHHTILDKLSEKVSGSVHTYFLALPVDDSENLTLNATSDWRSGSTPPFRGSSVLNHLLEISTVVAMTWKNKGQEGDILISWIFLQHKCWSEIPASAFYQYQQIKNDNQ
ncbi:hypothetical protein POM88_000578 [Heracleum sosnowskyi]|uniref:Uncharacterized protein n=1 Tax=Heracleum sosnowskyi TaxID=360622 RepID=A0AAD8JBT5_9APIA|nr:hypothetical protein POM88_000578 [Heracleum sosnowskyi]